jgi:hypothetical protein
LARVGRSWSAHPEGGGHLGDADVEARLVDPDVPPKDGLLAVKGPPVLGREPDGEEADMSSTVATTLWHLGATELAELIRSGQASCREVVEAHLRLIEEVNPRLNAVVLVLSEQALEAATVADRAVAAGDPPPVLHGVPLTVKESIDLVGTPTTVGLQALAEAYPQPEELMAAMPADAQQFLAAAFYEVAGPSDPLTTVAASITRHELLRAWGEFQEDHPLIIAPRLHTGPLRGRQRPRRRRRRANHPRHAHGHRRQRPRAARRRRARRRP